MALNVLVAFASRHGSTASLADEIGSALDDHLGAAGLPAFVDVLPVEHVGSVDRYDVVVVGSAVYLGRWLSSARRFVIRNASALAGRPVWLYSSGPVGEAPVAMEPPRCVLGLARLIEARGHRSFAGRLDRRSLHLAERLVVRLTNTPYGDARDFAAVRSWAAGIATVPLTPVAAAAGEGRT
jgi:menaquinone-dependent protoporphyrinogen oxidase